jgi:hypothetical protein
MQLKVLQKHLYTHVYWSTIYNSQTVETAKMPQNQQMDMWYLYTTEFYLAQRRMKFCHSQMNGWN